MDSAPLWAVVLLVALVPLTWYQALESSLPGWRLPPTLADVGYSALAAAWSVLAVGAWNSYSGAPYRAVPSAAAGTAVWGAGFAVAYAVDALLERRTPASSERDYASSQAVTVYLRGDVPADETCPTCDIMELEMLLDEALEPDALGWYDGDAVGPDEWILFLYGPDAEALFAAIEPVLRSYPLCRNALVEIQANGPDGPARTVMLGGAA